jgi:methionine sulfoxide reductase heme-binding subunit
VAVSPLSLDTLWYLARGTGTVALILFTVTLALGVGNRSGRSFAGLSPLVVGSVHRSSSLLSLIFLAVHVISLFFDPYAQLRLIDLVVPFGSGYRPLWVGLGAVALDLALAVLVTSLLRERIGLRAWGVLHLISYAMWPVALLHSVGSGTDRARPWMIAIDIVCALAVLAAALSRVGRPPAVVVTPARERVVAR